MIVDIAFFYVVVAVLTSVWLMMKDGGRFYTKGVFGHRTTTKTIRREHETAVDAFCRIFTKSVFWPLYWLFTIVLYTVDTKAMQTPNYNESAKKR